MSTYSSNAHHFSPCCPLSPFPLVAPPDQKLCFKSNVPFRQLSEIVICIQNSWRLYFCVFYNIQNVLYITKYLFIFCNMEGIPKSHQSFTLKISFVRRLLLFFFFFLLPTPLASARCLLGGWLWPSDHLPSLWGKKAGWIEKERRHTHWTFTGDNLLPCFIKPGTGCA